MEQILPVKMLMTVLAIQRVILARVWTTLLLAWVIPVPVQTRIMIMVVCVPSMILVPATHVGLARALQITMLITVSVIKAMSMMQVRV
jgi:hypothetical protein